MISFVVPAHNEERLLPATLQAIHAAARRHGEPYEVVVADDASTDGTAAVAEAAGARVVHVTFRQISRTRNAGAQAAAGDTLIFVDADTLVTPAVVSASIAALRAGAAGGGANVEVDGALPLWARVFLPTLLAVMRSLRLAAGCCIFCSRAAFDAAGGFDERVYAAEEIFFSRALARAGRVVMLREAVTTSGRKLRTHSVWDLFRLCGGLLRQGTDVVRSRDALSLWYGPPSRTRSGVARERRHDG